MAARSLNKTFERRCADRPREAGSGGPAKFTRSNTHCQVSEFPTLGLFGAGMPASSSPKETPRGRLGTTAGEVKRWMSVVNSGVPR